MTVYRKSEYAHGDRDKCAGKVKNPAIASLFAATFDASFANVVRRHVDSGG